MENRIKEIRASKKMSQEKLASLAGISRPFLSSVESGRAYPTIKTAAAIASALGCTVSELFPA